MQHRIYHSGGDTNVYARYHEGKLVDKERLEFKFTGFSNGIHPYYQKQKYWIKTMLKNEVGVILNVLQVSTVAEMADDIDIELVSDSLRLPSNFNPAQSTNGWAYVLFQDTEMGRGWAVLFRQTEGIREIITQDHRDSVLSELIDGGFIRSFGVDYQYCEIPDVEHVPLTLSV